MDMDCVITPSATTQADLLTGFRLVSGIHHYIYPDYRPPTRREVINVLLDATRKLLDGGDEELTLSPGSPLRDVVIAIITAVYPDLSGVPTEVVPCR